MEHINKIEIAGLVGAVREQRIGTGRLVRFSVMVENVYSGQGEAVVDTQWFACSYWGDKPIWKGQEIHLEGRMAQYRYADAEGNERVSYEIKVQKIY